MYVSFVMMSAVAVGLVVVFGSVSSVVFTITQVAAVSLICSPFFHSSDILENYLYLKKYGICQRLFYWSKCR